MQLETSKRIHEIYYQVLNDPKYQPVATAYKDALNELQRKGQMFTQEQWETIDRYITVFTNYMETMMEIALETDVPPIC